MRTPLAAKTQPANGATELVVELTTTRDMDDGQSLPPLIENGCVWHVVRRANGRTLWRRLFLKSRLFSRHHRRAAPGD